MKIVKVKIHVGLRGKGCSEESPKLSPRHGKIKNVIGVISGKGGVGKSTVTGIMAVTLARKVIK